MKAAMGALCIECKKIPAAPTMHYCFECAENKGMTCPCMNDGCVENAASIEAKRRRDAMTPAELAEERAAGKAWYAANKRKKAEA